ncbi:MAG: autotransporter outer membrane beta-barrel domain-containing protein [Rickettsiales bacterium]|nr:autotransporter outer membrane beta-barrel domain-containing protein [Rickettsiales bacterium]
MVKKKLENNKKEKEKIDEKRSKKVEELLDKNSEKEKLEELKNDLDNSQENIEISPKETMIISSPLEVILEEDKSSTDSIENLEEEEEKEEEKEEEEHAVDDLFKESKSELILTKVDSPNSVEEKFSDSDLKALKDIVEILVPEFPLEENENSKEKEKEKEKKSNNLDLSEEKLNNLIKEELDDLSEEEQLQLAMEASLEGSENSEEEKKSEEKDLNNLSLIKKGFSDSDEEEQELSKKTIKNSKKGKKSKRKKSEEEDSEEEDLSLIKEESSDLNGKEQELSKEENSEEKNEKKIEEESSPRENSPEEENIEVEKNKKEKTKEKNLETGKNNEVEKNNENLAKAENKSENSKKSGRKISREEVNELPRKVSKIVMMENMEKFGDIYDRNEYSREAGTFKSDWKVNYVHAGLKNSLENNVVGILLDTNYLSKDGSMIFGINGSLDKHSITGNKSKTKVNAITFGIYGGFVGNRFDVQSAVAFGESNFALKKGLDYRSRFSGHIVSFDTKIAARFRPTDFVLLRPFVGVQIVELSFGSFIEKNPLIGRSIVKHSLTAINFGVALTSTDIFPINLHMNIGGKYIISDGTMFSISSGIGYKVKNNITLGTDINYQGNKNMKIFGLSLKVEVNF